MRTHPSFLMFVLVCGALAAGTASATPARRVPSVMKVKDMTNTHALVASIKRKLTGLHYD